MIACDVREDCEKKRAKIRQIFQGMVRMYGAVTPLPPGRGGDSTQ
jgi:hypothetical protein